MSPYYLGQVITITLGEQAYQAPVYPTDDAGCWHAHSDQLERALRRSLRAAGISVRRGWSPRVNLNGSGAEGIRVDQAGREYYGWLGYLPGRISAPVDAGAATLGARGGAVKNPAKARAARRNGRKGGRPNAAVLAERQAAASEWDPITHLELMSRGLRRARREPRRGRETTREGKIVNYLSAIENTCRLSCLADLGGSEPSRWTGAAREARVEAKRLRAARRERVG